MFAVRAQRENPPACITPVNESRVLFDAYFGLDLALLPDRNYIWPNQSDIYTYIGVSDKLAP